MGIGDRGDEPANGRLLNYRVDPPLSDAAFTLLGRLTAAAVANLKSFDRRHAGELTCDRGLLLILLTLSRLSLEELAYRDAAALIDGALDHARALASG